MYFFPPPDPYGLALLISPPETTVMDDRPDPAIFTDPLEELPALPPPPPRPPPPPFRRNMFRLGSSNRVRNGIYMDSWIDNPRNVRYLCSSHRVIAIRRRLRRVRLGPSEHMSLKKIWHSRLWIFGFAHPSHSCIKRTRASGDGVKDSCDVVWYRP